MQRIVAIPFLALILMDLQPHQEVKTDKIQAIHMWVGFGKLAQRLAMMHQQQAWERLTAQGLLIKLLDFQSFH